MKRRGFFKAVAGALIVGPLATAAEPDVTISINAIDAESFREFTQSAHFRRLIRSFEELKIQADGAARSAELIRKDIMSSPAFMNIDELDE